MVYRLTTFGIIRSCVLVAVSLVFELLNSFRHFRLRMSDSWRAASRVEVCLPDDLMSMLVGLMIAILFATLHYRF